MTQTGNLSEVVVPVTRDELMSALLDVTGDLDTAQVLYERLPAWWVKADSQVLQAIEQLHADSERPREKLHRLLGRLKPLDQFCRERLTAFLATKGLAGLDIDHDTLDLPRRSFSGVGADLGGRLIETINLERHSLLQAAMQNFSDAAAEVGGIPFNAVVRVGPGRAIAQNLTAHTFVGYCRELNLGEAYQAHIREVFNLPAPTEGSVDTGRGHNPAVREVGHPRCLDMQIDLQVAYGKGDIDAPTRALLLGVVRVDLPASDISNVWFNGQPLTWQGLNINGTCLWGVLVFSSSAAEGFSNGPIVVYMPNEPVRPWYRYESLEQFKVYLALKLQVSAYRGFFTRYLDESERFDFFQRFDQNKTLVRVEPLAVTSNLSTFFFNACVGKLRLDALVLAVPNAQADDDARRQRIQNYLDIGLTVLNVAGLMVPVIGQLMMGVAVGQILGEVFEGVDDWVHQDKHEALRHLTNVAENLAAMALFAAGTKVVGRLWRSTPSTSRLYDKVEGVRMPDQTTRLWRTRTEPYRRSISLQGRVAGPRGVYQVDGQSYVNIDGGVYSITFDARSGRWRAVHPRRASAYQPPVSHNFQGGWQFSFERPYEWENVEYILGRLDPTLKSFTPEQLRDIAAITDMNLSRLKQLARDNLPLPERLRDCAQRFRQNQGVRDLVWQMENEAPLDATTSHVQMQALPLMDGWPQGRFFELLDEEGYVLERHPDTAPFDYEDLSIHLTAQQLKSGQIIPTLLAALDDEEKLKLLEGTFQPGEEPAILTQRLTASIKQNHRALYERLRAHADVGDRTDHGLLKDRHPRLPIRLAWEVMSKASSAERLRLRHTRHVPLRLSQWARETQEVLEEDEALTGLYVPELANDATRRIATGLLRRLPGWPEDMSLNVRRERVGGEVLAQVGDSDVAVTRVVVQSAKGFRAHDGQGAPLGALAGGSEGFYTALLDCLTSEQLDAMHLTGNGRASHLRHAIISKSQDERSRIARYLWPERALPQERAPVCIQAIPAQPQRFPRGLEYKVRKLYPWFDSVRVSSFLQGLGSDDLARANAVRAREEQYEKLQRTLKLWAKEKVVQARSDQALRDVRQARHQAAEAIKNSWRYASLASDAEGRKVPSLSLDGMTLAGLPTLPPDVQFDHVQQLSLKRMGLNDDVSYFIRHFKGVRALELTDNQLTRLPEVLQQMKQLSYLYLDHNRLQLTEYTRTKLADLRALKVLNLSNNPLLDPPIVHKMLDLQTLALRNCRLTSLPAGIRNIPGLKRLDLRGNDIASLPAWLFDSTLNRPENIHLDQNPLDDTSRQLLSTHKAATGEGMGFLEDHIGRLNEQRAKALWLGDERLPAYAEKAATWKGLWDEPVSDGLFNLLAGLEGTADSMYVREDMETRVWEVLDAIAADDELRTTVFDLAATPLNCDDSAAVTFSDVQTMVLVREAVRKVESGEATAKPLLSLGKGLFRLDQLASIARRYSSEHPALDPLEVHLAFRTGLVERLHLPGQPRHMRYASLAGVTQHMLRRAEAQVKEAELSPQLLKYLAKQPWWVKYLKITDPDAFEALSQPFRARSEELFDKRETLDDATYKTEIDRIGGEQDRAESAELERQTEAALRADDLDACALPPSR